MYLVLKVIHMTCAMLSISGFTLRGIWLLQGSPLLNQKLTKVLPHIIDTVFLLSGIGVVYSLDVSLFEQSWLQTKIVLLLVYIALGTIALKTAKTLSVQIVAFFAALLCFVYIIGIAINKTPLSWFS